MTRLANWKRILMTALAGATLSACGPKPAPETPDAGPTREAVIAAAGTLIEPVARPLTAVGDAGEVVDRYPADRSWSCLTQRYSAAEVLERLPVFSPDASVIFPGSLLQGGSLESGAPLALRVERAGGTVTVDLPNESHALTVDDLSLAKVLYARNRLLGGKPGAKTPAYEVEVELARIESYDELALAIPARAKWLEKTLKPRLELRADKRYTRYLLKLTQPYYVMSWSRPQSLDGVFADSVTAGELEEVVRPGNPALYVSSVTYGRQYYVLLESTASVQEVERALKYVKGGGLSEASAEAKAEYQQVQGTVSLKTFAVGGGASALDAVLAITVGPLDGLRAFVGITSVTVDAANPGVPLSYEVRHLADDAPVKVGVAAEVVKKSCAPVIENDAKTSLWLDAQHEGVVADSALYAWPNRATGRARAPGHAAVRSNAINGRQAVEFDRWTSFHLDLGSGDLAASDYTVVSVLRATGGEGVFLRSRTEQYPWYSDPFALGFRSGGLVQAHSAQDFVAAAQPTNTGDLLSFRFSRTEGKAITQNGALRGADRQQVYPQQSDELVLGADLLQGGFEGFIGEVRVFNVALSPLEQKTVECGLGAKWGIAVSGCLGARPDPALMQY